MYNKDNVFYKILRSEIPCRKVYENDIALAFYDIAQLCKVHVLVITKGLYRNFADFIAQTSPEEVKSFFDTVAHVTEIVQVSDSGYRLVTNIGSHSGQEVEHFHMHILGGEPLGAVLK